MAKGRQSAEWCRASLLAAIIRNSYFEKSKERSKPFEPWEFDPYADGPPPAQKKPKIKIKVDCLKGLCKR